MTFGRMSRGVGRQPLQLRKFPINSLLRPSLDQITLWGHRRGFWNVTQRFLACDGRSILTSEGNINFIVA